MTEPNTVTRAVTDLIELHSAYGENIEFDDADRNTYSPATCRYGMPLGMHLSLEAHRAGKSKHSAPPGWPNPS
ncbi:hypothetical protein ACFVTM_08855 [Arthrobacter sp. NPDC058130]|uniref:hypothetical protein n=1 Tax=Arthrobacter sp. NPDC058130 TaxID=3346353 RepID=UPI0036EED755